MASDTLHVIGLPNKWRTAGRLPSQELRKVFESRGHQPLSIFVYENSNHILWAKVGFKYQHLAAKALADLGERPEADGRVMFMREWVKHSKLVSAYHRELNDVVHRKVQH